MKIGVFDSGVGGITVLHQLQSAYPNDSFYYFGDTANVPYGSKSISMIQSLCQSAALRMRDHQINALVVACNTASSLALNEMKLIMPGIPILGMVEAGVHAVKEGVRDLSESHHPANVLVLGTRATIQSQIYSKTLHSLNLNIRVLEKACPLFVPMIEEGWTDHPILLQTVEWYLKDFKNIPPGLVLLGCTHYPWIKDAIAHALPRWTILDAARSAAILLKSQISKRISESQTSPKPVEWYFSDPDALSPYIRGTEHIQVPRSF